MYHDTNYVIFVIWYCHAAHVAHKHKQTQEPSSDLSKFQVNRIYVSVSIQIVYPDYFPWKSYSSDRCHSLCSYHVQEIKHGDRGSSLHISRRQQTKGNNKLHRKAIIKLDVLFFFPNMESIIWSRRARVECDCSVRWGYTTQNLAVSATDRLFMHSVI